MAKKIVKTQPTVTHPTLEEVEILLRGQSTMKARRSSRQPKAPKQPKDHAGAIQAKNGHAYKSYNEWKPRHRLTEQEVLSIVELAKTEPNMSEIARQHDVHPAMVKAVLSGKLWSRVTGIAKK